MCVLRSSIQTNIPPYYGVLDFLLLPTTEYFCFIHVFISSSPVYRDPDQTMKGVEHYCFIMQVVPSTGCC